MLAECLKANTFLSYLDLVCGVVGVVVLDLVCGVVGIVVIGIDELQRSEVVCIQSLVALPFV